MSKTIKKLTFLAALIPFVFLFSGCTPVKSGNNASDSFNLTASSKYYQQAHDIGTQYKKLGKEEKQIFASVDYSVQDWQSGKISRNELDSRLQTGLNQLSNNYQSLVSLNQQKGVPDLCSKFPLLTNYYEYDGFLIQPYGLFMQQVVTPSLGIGDMGPGSFTIRKPSDSQVRELYSNYVLNAKELEKYSALRNPIYQFSDQIKNLSIFPCQ